METKEITTVNFALPSTLVGQRLDGRFLIEKDLTDEGADAGGIGVVYLASDEKLMGRRVVVKILQERSLEHGDLVRKFQHEKEALIRLDHPGIVRILDSGELTDGNPFMVMEFIDGWSLRRELRGGTQMTFERAAQIIASVTDALGAAHAKKVLHRDIKPENIMLTVQEGAPDRVRLIDFGIARVGESQLAPATEVQRAIGTVLYIAPEQLIGDPILTPAADIFAAGIVAYEMLTGRLPFNPRSIVEMYQLEKEGVKTLPSELRRDLPKAAETLILAALEFDPAKRPQNAREFGRELASALRSGDADLALADTISYVGEDEVETRNRTAFVEPVRSRSGTWKWALMLIALFTVFGAGAVALARYFSAAGGSGTEPPTAAQKPVVLSYFLTVQKMRNGRAFEQPFRSSGQEIFESGYKFALHFKPAADGFLYVFNEGKDGSGSPAFFLISPSPTFNDGRSAVAGGKEIVTAQNTFSGGRGTELLWLIWSREKLEDLEAVWESVGDEGRVSANHAETCAAYIKKYERSKADWAKDSATQSTILRGNGDLAIHRFELEHR